MKFSELYKSAIDLWPSEISINDGYPTGEDGYFFPELTNIKDQIETNINPDNHWLNIITWSIFQALHAESKKLIKLNTNILNVKDIPLEEFEWRVRENIRDKEWQDLRTEYVNDLQAT